MTTTNNCCAPCADKAITDAIKDLQTRMSAAELNIGSTANPILELKANVSDLFNRVGKIEKGEAGEDATIGNIKMSVNDVSDRVGKIEKGEAGEDATIKSIVASVDDMFDRVGKIEKGEPGAGATLEDILARLAALENRKPPTPDPSLGEPVDLGYVEIRDFKPWATGAKCPCGSPLQSRIGKNPEIHVVSTVCTNPQCSRRFVFRPA